MQLVAKERASLLKSMQISSSILTEKRILVKDMDPQMGVGASCMLPPTKGGYEYEIEIASAMDIKKPSANEVKYILYGVDAHECLHILRTDFARAVKEMKKFTESEVRIRMNFANIVEDPAIEYLRSSRFSDFQNGALDAAIGYFYMISPELGSQSSPLEELITAFIQFGDVGILKGSFAFNEAKEAFISCLPVFEEAIQEPVFINRFRLSQEMFEICRPLWEADLQASNEQMQQALRNMKKNGQMSAHPSSLQKAGSPADDGQEPSGSSSSQKGNERRRETVKKLKSSSLCRGSASHEDRDEQGTDSSSSSKSCDEDSPSKSDSNAVDSGAAIQKLRKNFIGLSEEDASENCPDQPSCKTEGTEKEGNAGSVSGQREGDHDDAVCSGDVESLQNSPEEAVSSSEQGEDTATASEDKQPVSDNGNENETLSDKKAEDPEADTEEAQESSGTDEGDLPPTGEQCFPADGTPVSQDMGEVLTELSKQLCEELNAELQAAAPSMDDIETMEEAAEMAEKLKAREERDAQIDVNVESPFYKDVQYTNVEVGTAPYMESAIDRYRDLPEMKRRVIHLKAAFKKIFTFQYGKKTYRTNGRIDLERLAGKKLTARMFTRRSDPSDKADLSVCILIDQSGSMRSDMEYLHDTLYLILESLKGFGVKAKVIGFTSGYNDKITYFHYGDRKWTINDSLIAPVIVSGANGGTFLGHALRYAGTLLKKRPENNKLFVCITDGDPEAAVYENRNQGLLDCRNAVAEVRKYAGVIGIGIFREGSDSEKKFKYIFQDSCVSMGNLDTLIKILPQKIKKLLGQ